jgi:hypothetical protein
MLQHKSDKVFAKRLAWFLDITMQAMETNRSRLNSGKTFFYATCALEIKGQKFGGSILSDKCIGTIPGDVLMRIVEGFLRARRAYVPVSPPVGLERMVPLGTRGCLLTAWDGNREPTRTRANCREPSNARATYPDPCVAGWIAGLQSSKSDGAWFSDAFLLSCFLLSYHVGYDLWYAVHVYTTQAWPGEVSKATFIGFTAFPLNRSWGLRASETGTRFLDPIDTSKPPRKHRNCNVFSSHPKAVPIHRDKPPGGCRLRSRESNGREPCRACEATGVPAEDNRSTCPALPIPLATGGGRSCGTFG